MRHHQVQGSLGNAKDKGLFNFKQWISFKPAVDRTGLDLKSFTDQNRRFFPYLDDGTGLELSISKKQLCAHTWFTGLVTLLL